MNLITKHSQNKKIVLRVAIVGIVANLVAFILKLVLGLIYNNLSVISDAVHSASDLATTVLMIFAVFISSPKMDKKHNYGHEKIEPLMVLFFALIIAGVGGMLAYQGVLGLINPKEIEINFYLIGVTVVSLVLKEALFWYGMHYAKKIKSEMLKADAWHSRSDSLSSVAVLIGLIISGFISTNIAESIAVLVVAVFIFKVAFNIFKPAVNQLIDKAAPEETCEKIKQITLATNGVTEIKSLRTRLFGDSILVDLEIVVNGALPVQQAHEIATNVHDALEADEKLSIKHCAVTTVPCEAKELD
jgi:cation diffusion facilitator family transporter